MPFDPDKYLAKKSAFDPDKFLASKSKEKTVGQRNLEKFGPGDVGPSFLEQVLDTAVPATAGLSQGLTAGFADEIGGGLQAVAQDIGSLFSDEISPGNYEAERDKLRAATEQAADENPAAYMAGEIGGAIGGAAVAPGAGALKAAGHGVLYGAGAAQEMADVLEQAAIGGAIGGVAAKALPAVVGGAKKLGQGIVDRSAKKMAAKVQAISDDAATQANVSKTSYLNEAAEDIARKTQLEEHITALKAAKAEERAFNRLMKTGRYSEESAAKQAKEASNKVIDTANTKAAVQEIRNKSNVEAKADKLYKKEFERILKEGKEALERPTSSLGTLRDTMLGKQGTTLAGGLKAAAKLSTGLSTVETSASLAKALGLKSAKALSNISPKALNALKAASEKAGAPGSLAVTHDLLMKTDESYRKAVTKSQESE